MVNTKIVHKQSIAYKLIAKGFTPQIKNNYKTKFGKFVFIFEITDEFLKEFDKLMTEHEEMRKRELLYN